MNHLRATVRALVFCVVTGVLYVLFVTVTILAAPFKQAAQRWRNFIFRSWAKVIAAVLGMKLRVSGTPPVAPFFLVSNHLSYVDVIVFAAQLDCVFVAKQDVARWPVLGALCRSINTILVDRERRQDVARVNELITQTLAAEYGVMLFPEGTSSPGERVLPFKASLLAAAAQANYPVSYASVSYRTPANQAPAHLAVCWWGEMTFLAHLYALFQLPEFEASVVFGAQTIQATERKVLADRLWRAISQQFIPVIQNIHPEEECSTATNQQPAIQPAPFLRQAN
jgi:1-acyl-sn-glycerol-3-phosphate acyltransferase